MISTEVFGSSDEVGSSASSSRRLLHHRARDADALALAAGKRSPRAGVAKPDSPTTSSSSKARVDVVCAGTCAATRATRTRSPGARESRFSITVRAARPGCIPGTPCRCAGGPGAAPCAAASTRSCPSNSIAPEVGSTSRLMQRMSVLLPVPEGPMIAVMPRGATSRVDVGKHRLAGDVVLGEMPDRQRRRRRRGPRRLDRRGRRRVHFFFAAFAASRAVSFS